jgi:hypothetical protein
MRIGKTFQWDLRTTLKLVKEAKAKMRDQMELFDTIEEQVRVAMLHDKLDEANGRD